MQEDIIPFNISIKKLCVKKLTVFILYFKPIFSVVYFADPDFNCFVVPNSYIELGDGEYQVAAWPPCKTLYEATKTMDKNLKKAPIEWPRYAAIVIAANSKQISFNVRFD